MLGVVSSGSLIETLGCEVRLRSGLLLRQAAEQALALLALYNCNQLLEVLCKCVQTVLLNSYETRLSRRSRLALTKLGKSIFCAFDQVD